MPRLHNLIFSYYKQLPKGVTLKIILLGGVTLKIVLLDGISISSTDLSWDKIRTLGDFIDFQITPQDKVCERSRDADILLVSNANVNEEILSQCKNLKYIGSTATGYDHIDIKYAMENNIAVTHVPTYSTDAVAQHTFALILEITNNVGLHNISTHNGKWSSAPHFCYWEKSLSLLSGKSLGIIGYGNIGKKVGEIAKAFGMTVNVYSENKIKAIESDIITLHCPETAETSKMINSDFISNMKDGAILINAARGGLLNENDVAKALISGKLSAAGVDVLSKEPPEASNPLFSAPNCYITPHLAWTPIETRQKVIDIVYENLNSFLNGGDFNRIV